MGWSGAGGAESDVGAEHEHWRRVQSEDDVDRGHPVTNAGEHLKINIIRS